MNRSRFGLRTRVITLFGIGALLLSMLLAGVTFTLTRNQLLDRRGNFAYDSSEQNSGRLNSQLSSRTDTQRFVGLMEQLVTPDGAQQGMLYRGEYYWTDTLAFTEVTVPESLVAQMVEGNAAQMTFTASELRQVLTADEVDDAADPEGSEAESSEPPEFTDVVVEGETYHAVTFPLPDAEANAAYILATPLGDIEDTLGQLNATLLGAAAITTLLGIGFGVYVATRLFSPLAEISQAAEQIAEGDLSTRLDEEADPDLARLVHSFNDMTSALEERIERDSRFASDVSHELRSPLMTLTGSVALLEKRRDEMPERSIVALDLLSADIRRFKVLVEDLLEISRFDVGAVKLETEEVMLGEFVHHALRAATSGRDIQVIHTEETDQLIVDIDKRRIAQVIRNLSENADKYAGGVTQARIVRFDNGVRIEIEDEGPGVPVDEREVIFERFSRGSEGGRRGSGSGVGLGLSLVTEHLRLHGGTISVTDRVYGLLGSRFIIELPDVVVDE